MNDNNESGAARSGRHFLQVPGPTNVPDRILGAMAQPTIDHRGTAFAALTLEIISGLRRVFNTSGPIMIYPGSATGGWEAGITNTLSPGDKILMFDSGFFALNWKIAAVRFGLEVDFVSCDWRHGVDPDTVEEKLKADASHEFKSVMVVHNETSSGITNSIAAIREAMNHAGHPALLMVDAVSSAGSIEYRQDDWGVDVTIAGSQKGLMLPPGLSFNVVSEKAIAAGASSQLPSSYWNWKDVLPSNETGQFPYTPATNLLFGLREALSMLEAEGWSNIYVRHARLAEATRRAVAAWGFENYCAIPAKSSNTVTTVLLPESDSADELRAVILRRYDMSLGAGLGPLADKVFRIGHLGSFNELMLAGTLSGIEMGLAAAGISHSTGGVTAALDYLKT
ncbi:MAG: aminotransferase class V-fold PLP-dependent enzyme [Gammaproteobacteria bacterium]|nr:aminotransferase class V-fold PLP-dependent enzyme [Gammaproteobacteria bacterium]